jgi:hypothetical protein
MIISTSKVAYTFKTGQEVDLSTVAPFTHHGLPWFEIIQEHFQEKRARITIDTTIEITVSQVLK